ncbi:lipase [Geothrix limicola]|uniref:Lipase n=1 Tax=Geothrix limicola TaxID=2927978 RepID=A0ABQ5QCQ9_9BACT|nr:GDSL-type esterase/lipase family protein [Geothrix limicola]GLH72131.1 lipase [Geothrix limicola]
MRKIAMGLWVVSRFLSIRAEDVHPNSPTQVQIQARARLEAWRDSRQASLRDDWGELARYRAANQTLPAPKADESRVVFFGDSITEAWPLAQSFPGRPYVNRGISGQTTAQMLLRFRPDVINLKPRVVFILAGTNDISGNTGPTTDADILANLASMGDMATANGIRIVFCSILPVHNGTPQARDFYATRPMERIRGLNQGLQALCKAKGYAYLDAFTPMLDGRGFLKVDLAEDGLHPNGAGYRVLASLVESTLQNVLTKG